MWAYLFPDSKITVSSTGAVKISGMLAEYHSRIAFFIRELGLTSVTIRFWSGRFYFTRSIDVGTQHRLRKFFVAACPHARR